MKRVIQWSIATFMLSAALVAGCGGDGDSGALAGPPPGPTAGSLNVNLTTPSVDDGAMVLTISGGVIQGVKAPSARTYWIRSRTLSPTSVFAVVVGDLGTGPVAVIDVPDVDAASSYSASVVEVADRASELRASLSGYALNVSR